MSEVRSRVIAAAALLLASCRPAPAPVSPGRRSSPLFVLTPERLYTDAPVGEGISFVPVTERALERRAGGVEVAIRYPAIALPDEGSERELAAAIGEAAALERWTAEEGKELVGAVVVTCSAGVVTTELVSFACEHFDTTITREAARRGEGGAPLGPRVVARAYEVAAGTIRRLGWAQILRPGVEVKEVVARALTLAELAPHEREVWRDGACTEDLPGFSLEPKGLRLWPDVVAGPCVSLLLAEADLAAFIVPNGRVARALRIGEVEPEAPELAEP